MGFYRFKTKSKDNATNKKFKSDKYCDMSQFPTNVVDIFEIRIPVSL